MKKVIQKEHEDCECHRKYGETITCDLACFKCSGVKKVITTDTKGVKKIEYEF